MFMHRDFHCRNLLVRDDNNLGIIDFQGAMHGPLTYDLVSLLRDCYVDNDPDWIDQQVLAFHQNQRQVTWHLPMSPKINSFVGSIWQDCNDT